MRKIIILVLVFAMLFSGCSRWSVEIVDPTKPIEGESELVISEEEESKPEESEPEEQKTFPENTYFKDFCILLIRGDNNEKYYIEIPESEIKKLFAAEEFNNLAVPSDRSISSKNEKIATFYDKNRNSFEILVYDDDLLIMVHKDGRDENFSMPKTAEEKIRAFTEKIVSENIASGKILPNNAEEVFPVPEMEVFDIIRLFKEVYSPTVELNYEEQIELLKILNPENWTETETLPEKLEHKEIEPDNTFFSDSLNRKNVLYIYRYEGKCYIRQEWGIALDGKRCWIADLETADAIEAFRLSVYENFKNDGRWPYLDEEEEPYLKNPGVYDEEEFLKELDIFIDCTSGQHGAGTEFTAEKTGLYAITKAYRDGIDAGEVFEYDSDGRALVSKKAVNEAAKYGFGIREYSKYVPSENGEYVVPFDWPYKNPKVESIVTNGNYVYCTVNFYDLDDTEFEWPLEQKEYTFLVFEAEGKTRYRLVSMYYNYGGYGF